MPTFPVTEDSIVHTLRAAGCVFAEDEARLLIDAATTPADLDALVRRRVDGLPLEHVLGWAEFCGLRVAVGPGVFVPRRRTEFLVRRAAALTPPHAVVVDLCCGSGALGVALAAAVGPLDLYAADVDPAAVECARRNVVPIGGRVLAGDLDAPLPADLRGRVHILLANAPYVPSDDVALMPPEARVHEPRTALDGGGDGLDVLRRIIARAPHWLAPGGHLLFETSERQAPRIVLAVTRHGLRPEIVADPELGATVVIATWPDQPGQGTPPGPGGGSPGA